MSVHLNAVNIHNETETSVALTLESYLGVGRLWPTGLEHCIAALAITYLIFDDNLCNATLPALWKWEQTGLNKYRKSERERESGRTFCLNV